jgi:antitoxin PrlF
MTILTVTAKGQITFKQELLKHLGVNPGQKIEAEKLPDGQIIVKAVEQHGTVLDFIGCLSGGNKKTLSIEEINEITSKGWSGKK